MKAGLHLSLLLVLLGCAGKETRATSPQKVTLFFSAEVRGYLGPCGCSENMRGGISRAAFQVAEARKEGNPVYLVDTGDGLFGVNPVPDEAVPQQERKAQALAQAWKTMGLTVRAVGALDDARGPAFRSNLALPELGSGSFKVVDQIGLLSAQSIEEARAVATRARKAGARFVVALVPIPLERLLREGMEAQEIDLLVSSLSKDAFAAEENRLVGGQTKMAQVQSKGRSLLRVDVWLRGERPRWVRGDGERERELYALDQRIELLRGQVNEPMLSAELKALRKAKLEDVIGRRELLAAAPLPVPGDSSSAMARFIPLESTFPKDVSVQSIETDYDRDVGLINVAWAKAHGVSCPQATAERAGFVGSTSCFSCHPDAEKAWRQTRHPTAYASLKGVGKQHHLDCIGCHVTGWRQPQGVCRIDETANREEVGCESCHGPGSAHVAQPTKSTMARSVDAATCTTCHDRENSPHFDFERYLEKVLGPGHGRPKSK